MGPSPLRDDIIEAIIAAVEGDPAEFNGRVTGEQVRFTFDEYKEMGRKTPGRPRAKHPSTIRPYDASDDEIRGYLKATRRSAKAAIERERRARKKEQQKLANEVDCRAIAIFAVLTGTPQRIAALMKKLSRSTAFRATNGQLAPPSLRRAILRELIKASSRNRVGDFSRF